MNATRREYEVALVVALSVRGTDVDETILRRAMGRLSRHVSDKYGFADWASETSEAGTNNGVAFYDESARGGFGTFNRAPYFGGAK